MSTAEDELLLRRIWSQENLGQYEQQWIATRKGDVIASGPDILELAEHFLGEIREGDGPLFAFVSFVARV